MVGTVHLRRRLLLGSLAVAAVLVAVIGYAISRHSSNGGDITVIGPTRTLAEAPLNTNAKVDGRQLPRVDVQTIDRVDFSTADLLGRPLVINFWTSSCGPCRKELPDFAAVHREVGDRIRFVGLDSLAPSKLEQQFAEERGVNYELLFDTNGRFGTAAGISAQPVTLFVAADGTIVKQTGQIDAAGLRATIGSVFP